MTSGKTKKILESNFTFSKSDELYTFPTVVKATKPLDIIYNLHLSTLHKPNAA